MYFDVYRLGVPLSKLGLRKKLLALYELDKFYINDGDEEDEEEEGEEGDEEEEEEEEEEEDDD